jgi:RimJ/RimL family protein N-acetyltransferase
MKVIFEQEPYKVTLRNKASSKTIDLLKRTLWGTKETVYQHQHTEQNIDQVPDPSFFNLEKQGELIGTCCFSKRSTILDRQKYDVWYSRYFSIDSKKQGGIFGSMILKHIKAYFEKETLSPSVFYAYVDASNIRSSKLLNYIGFKVIRSFETRTFSRLYPKKNKHVSLIAAAHKDVMLDLLQDAYKDHILNHFDHSFLENNYYVLKKDNEIVAGIRANTAHWVIRALPGFSGTLIIKLLPYIPVLSRLFNPNDFRFAAFDGIYSKAGYEKELFVLMESVCASLKVTTGIMWLDSESSLNYRFKKSGNWGIMEKLKENIPAYVIAAFKNIPQDEQNKINSCPVYISAVDII